jgi:hypothetical protein
MRLLIFFVAIVFIPALYACNLCNNLDCLASNYDGRFRIISKADGKDLLFGANRIYNKDKIEFYTVRGNDTVRYNFVYEKLPGSGYDSVLTARFFPVTNTPVYLKLNDTDIDTLLISYSTSQTRCCGTITEITQFRYNNNTDLPGNQGTKELKK